MESLLKMFSRTKSLEIDPPDNPGARGLHKSVIQVLAQRPTYPVDEVTKLLLRHKQKHKLALVDVHGLEMDARFALQNLLQRAGHETARFELAPTGIDPPALQKQAVEVYQAIQNKRGSTL